MRKHFYAFFAIVLVAVLASLTSCSNKNTAEFAGMSTPDSLRQRLPIAYVDLDTLIAHYDYARELEQQLVDKMENDRANLNSRLASLRKRQEEFQRKVQNNAFLSQSSAEQQYQALLQEEAKLQQDAATIDQENLQAQQQMMKDLSDSIRAYIIEYNKVAGYEAILDRAATLYIEAAYDITHDIIEGLNKQSKGESSEAVATEAAADTTAAN